MAVIAAVHDLALVGGVARLAGRPVVGSSKGRDTRTMSPVTLAWLLRRLSQGDAVDGTRQSIWDAHFYRHTRSWAGIEAEHQGQGKRSAQSPRDVPAGCSNYLR